MVRCFLSIYMHILLSSNLRQVNLGLMVCTLKPFTFSSFFHLTISITSRRAVDSEMYLALVVLIVINYCIVLTHIIGQLTYIITYPFREWLDNISSNDLFCSDPSQSASTYYYNSFLLSLKQFIVLFSSFNTCIYVLRLLCALVIGH